MNMNEGIRVLFFVPGFSFGGIETVFLNTIKECKNKLNNRVIFTLMVEDHPESNHLKEARDLGVEIIRIPKFKMFQVCDYYRHIDETLKDHDFDIVHCCNITRSFILFFAAKKNSIKHRLFHVRTNRIEGNFLKRIILKTLLKLDIYLSTNLLANSKESGISLFKKRKFTIIKNGILTELFAPNLDHSITRRKETNTTNNFVIGHVGRFTEAKNHLFLIDLFEKVVQKDDTAMLLLVGDGPLFNSVNKIVEERGLESKILFTGARSDIEEWYCIMDVFVFPSLYEGFGNVAVEAQAAGLPVLASNNVPNSVNITGNVRFLSLDLGVDKWADEVLSYKGHLPDSKAYLDIEKSGYGSHLASIQLLNYYHNVFNGDVNEKTFSN